MSNYPGQVLAYDAANHEAEVMLVGSMSRILRNVPVAQHIRAHLVVVGATCAVAILGEGFQPLLFAIMDGPGTTLSCRVTASTTFYYNTWKRVPFTNEHWDPLAMHDNSVNNSRLYAPIAGKYHISAGIGWAGTSGGIRIVAIRRGESTVIAEDRRFGFAWIQTHVSGEYNFSAGQYATVWGYLDTAAQAAGVWAAMHWTGP